MIAQGCYLYTPAPSPVNGFPAFLGLLLAAFTFLFAAEAGYLLMDRRRLPRRAWRCAAAGAVLSVLAAFLLLIGYFLAYRVDGGLWCFAVLAATGLCLCGSLRRPSNSVDADKPPPALALSVSTLSPTALAAADATRSSSSNVSSDGRASLHWAQRPQSSTIAGAAAPSGGRTSATACTDSARAACAAPSPPCCAPCLPARTTRGGCALASAHATLWVITLAFLLLMLGGCWTQAGGYRAFPPRGHFYSIVTGDAVQTVHAWCTGDANATRPTVWMEVGGGGHSMSDLYNLRWELNGAGWRTCSYDPPGTGWSGYAVAHQPDVTTAIMAAMGETGPFIMLGVMDSGPARIYSYALAHPAAVRTLIPMIYGPPEFLTIAAYRGWDMTRAAAEAKPVLAQRLGLCDLVRGIAVQWGLLPLFAPLDANYTGGLGVADTQAEKMFLNLYNEKQWSMQCAYLAEQVWGWGCGSRVAARRGCTLRVHGLYYNVGVAVCATHPVI